VTGHLWLSGVEVDTVDTTFVVTVVGEDGGGEASACDAVGFSTVIKEEGYPTFELGEVTDPYTGANVKYTVTIPQKIKDVFDYEESDLLIYSKINTKDAGFTGLYTIVVDTTCD